MELHDGAFGVHSEVAGHTSPTSFGAGSIGKIETN